MGDDTRPFLVLVAGFGALIALMVALLFWTENVACESKWADSGHESQYATFSGCRVQLEDGTWVPQERLLNMREA